MNAYELAVKLENKDRLWSVEEQLMIDVCNILRQQADRIDKLEREAVAKNNYLEQHCQKIDQQADRIAELEKQGEPVAWMEYIQDEEWEVWYTKPTDLPEGHSYKPLYLAPQTKPLSEKELYEVFDKCYPNNGDGDVVTLVDFARAIEERHGIK